MRPPASGKRRGKRRFQKPKTPVFRGAFRAVSQATGDVAGSVADVGGLAQIAPPPTPATPPPPPTTSGAGAAAAAASNNPFSGDPWEVAKKIVDDDIAAQTKVIQGQKDQAAARNQAILNTFLGFQAALSKLSGTLGPQYDAAMKDLSTSQESFKQGFQDASNHIGGQTSPEDTARAHNPF